MSDHEYDKAGDYLWDGSGPPDGEVARLEKLLGTIRYDEPLRSNRVRFLVLAVVTLAAAAVVFVSWPRALLPRFLVGIVHDEDPAEIALHGGRDVRYEVYVRSERDGSRVEQAASAKDLEETARILRQRGCQVLAVEEDAITLRFGRERVSWRSLSEGRWRRYRPLSRLCCPRGERDAIPAGRIEVRALVHDGLAPLVAYAEQDPSRPEDVRIVREDDGAQYLQGPGVSRYVGALRADEAVRRTLPILERVIPPSAAQRKDQRTYVYGERVWLESRHFSAATAEERFRGSPALTFSAEGRELLEELSGGGASRIATGAYWSRRDRAWGRPRILPRRGTELRWSGGRPDIAESLMYPPLPLDLEESSSSDVQPTLGPSEAFVIRGLLGLAAGAMALGLAMLFAAARRPGSTRRGRARAILRACVTLAVPLLLWRLLEDSGVAFEVLDPGLGATGRASWSRFELDFGVDPLWLCLALLFLGYLAAELWRVRRWPRSALALTPSERHKIARTALLVSSALLVVILLGWSAFLSVRGLEVGVAGAGDWSLESGVGGPIGWIGRLGLVLLLLGTMLVFAGAAWLMERFGSVSAYGALCVLVLVLGDQQTRVVTDAWQIFPQPNRSWAWLLLVVTAILTFFVLRVRLKRERAIVRVPTCGILPLALPFVVTGIVLALAIVDPIAWERRIDHPTLGSLALYAPIWLLGILLFAAWFARPRRIASFCYARGANEVESAMRRLFWRATLISTGYVFAIGISGQILRVFASDFPISAVTAVVATAVVMDLGNEFWQRWRTPCSWRSIGAIHDVQAVTLATDALGRAGIATVVRGGNFHVLLGLLSPFAPTVIYVPEAQAEEGERVVAACFTQATDPAGEESAEEPAPEEARD